jgi:hypothetical protein
MATVRRGGVPPDAVQPVPGDGVAGHPAERGERGPGARRDAASREPRHLHPPAHRVVGARVGPAGLQFRRGGAGPVRHGRLRRHALLQRRATSTT